MSVRGGFASLVLNSSVVPTASPTASPTSAPIARSLASSGVSIMQSDFLTRKREDTTINYRDGAVDVGKRIDRPECHAPLKQVHL